MPNWLWQGLVSNWLSAVVVVAAGTAVGVLRAMRPELAIPIIYGLGTCGLLALVLLVIAALRVLPRVQPEESAEQRVRRWIDELGMSHRRQDNLEANFHIVVTTSPNRAPINIANPKRLPGVLMFQLGLIFEGAGGDFARLKTKASEKELRDLVLRMREKLLTLGLEYEGLEFDPKIVTIANAVAISPDLTLVEFTARLRSVEHAALLMTVMVGQEMARLDLLPGS